MSTQGPSERRIRLIRFVCFVFAVSSFVLGGLMMVDPVSAWGAMGIEVGPNPLVQAIYGGAIMGEGAMFALATVWPLRYLVFLQYLVLYKTFACIAGSVVLLRMDAAPVGGWLVISGWAFAGLTSALVFPWSEWSRFEEWHGAS